MDVGTPIARREASGLLVAPLDLLAAMFSEPDVIAGPAEGHGSADIGRRGGEIGEGVAEQPTEIAHALLELRPLQEGEPVLGDEDASPGQRPATTGVELAC